MNPRNVSLLLVLLASLTACSSDSGSSTPPGNSNAHGGVVDLNNNPGGGDQGGADQGGGDQSCGVSSGAESFPVYQKQINANSYNDFVYYNLQTHESVSMSAEEAARSSAWHIAFRRYDAVLNGGTSGPGSVTGAMADQQLDYYLADGKPNSSVFLNATPANELGSLENAVVDLNALEWMEDARLSGVDIPKKQVGTRSDMGWFFYDVTSHELTLNSDNWWIVRGGEGNTYARFHATSLAYDTVSGLSVSFAFEVQQIGQNSFIESAEFDASIPAVGGKQCFDYNNNAIVDCTGNQWDLQLELNGRDFILWTNSGLSGSGAGGAIGPYAQSQMVGYPSGTTDIFGNDFSGYYEADKSAGIFTEKSWYAYSLQGNHKLWPNYRVYMIDSDRTDCQSRIYKLQITSYYSEQGVSGYPTLRYQRVR